MIPLRKCLFTPELQWQFRGKRRVSQGCKRETLGVGGCCSPWSGDASPYGPMGNYFCGNSSAGGWVGYDDPRQGNRAQGLSPALPVGFTYDPAKFPQMAGWKDPSGAVMHVWRAQGWCVNNLPTAT